MDSEGRENPLKICLQRIEEKIARGDSASWTNYDFEKLSDAISDETGVRLSITTLKRVWGRIKYDHAPTLTTLNALAKFAGRNDWRMFEQSCGRQETPVITLMPQPESDQKYGKKLNPFWVAAMVPLLAAGYFFISSYGSRTKNPNPAHFEFKADKMKTEGVPNSVVFHYNASAATTDSIFIVQTWDVSRKKLVSRHNHEHSAIYYYPGFFRAKLIADGDIVKTHDLWITTDGWMCLAENNPVPVYFRKEEFMKGDRIEVDRETLEKYNLSLHPNPPRLRFYNQKDLGDLMNDNFVFETSLKSDFNEGSAACQFAQVLIQCKDDIIIIPLGAKACVGDMFLAFAGYFAESTDADLSAFGTDLTQWMDLRIEVIDKNAIIYVNNAVAARLTFPNDATGIVGVQYRFTGSGSIRKAIFSSGGKEYPLN